MNRSKSWLIVKSEALADEAMRVFGNEVNITTEGQRHLGAVIASQEYKDQYCEEKIRIWKEEIERLSEIAESASHSIHCLHKRVQVKVHLLHALNNSFEDYVDPIQGVIDDLPLPTLFGQSEPLPNEVRLLVTLKTAQGGLGMQDLRAEVPQQFSASKSITSAHVDSITSQNTFIAPGESSTEEL